MAVTPGILEQGHCWKQRFGNLVECGKSDKFSGTNVIPHAARNDQHKLFYYPIRNFAKKKKTVPSN